MHRVNAHDDSCNSFRVSYDPFLHCLLRATQSEAICASQLALQRAREREEAERESQAGVVRDDDRIMMVNLV